jgi:5-methylthioadenosine/S-adenosylhomocysteine deaminase
MAQEADILITNGTIVSMDGKVGLVAQGSVAVQGERIIDLGPADDLSHWIAGQSIDARGGIIMPGLVNTHTHAAMTLFRGLADDLPLMTWLNDHIFPAEAGLDYDKVLAGSKLACAEMILSGTTCFCDMYLFEEAVARAADEAHIRAVVGEVLYDFPSPNYGPIEKGFEYTASMMKTWHGHPLVGVAVEPHSPYLCAPQLLEKAAQLARENGSLLVIHVAETQSEVTTMKERYGRSPVAHLAELGVLGPDLLACHCVALDETDMTLMKEHDVKVAHNPESNMKLASGVAPVPDLLKKGIVTGLGTDGCSSNNNLDLFAEMDSAAKLHKVHRLDPTVVDAQSVLKMATIEAAKALGLGEEIGSLTIGKRADIIVIDTAKPHLTPMYNPFSHLVYAVNGADVSHSVINGRLVMSERRLLTMDLDAVMASAIRIAEQIPKKE